MLEGLTYYESLAVVIAKINEVVGTLNSGIDFTETEIAVFRAEINSWIATISSNTDDLVTHQASTDHVAEKIPYDFTGNTKITGANVQLALDDAETELKNMILGSANAEVGSAHVSTVKGKSFVDIDARFEEGESELADYANLVNSKNLLMLAGTIRNSGAGWAYIDDAGHEKINMSTVVVQTGSLRVEHTPSATKVGTLICSPDETFAKEGMICGASVGSTFSLIDMLFPLSVQVKGDGVFVSKTYFTSSLSVVFSADNSTFTLTHPECDALDVPSIICPISAGSSGEFAVSYSGTTVTVERRGDLAGYIYYDVATTSWKYAGECVNDLTFSFVAGVLTVTHSAVVGNLYALVLSKRDGGYNPVVVSPLTSSFQVKFYDSSNVLITVADANTKFYFARVGAKYKMPQKTTERVLIKRGHCKADAQYIVNASANVWIQGVMQI